MSHKLLKRSLQFNIFFVDNLKRETVIKQLAELPQQILVKSLHIN